MDRRESMADIMGDVRMSRVAWCAADLFMRDGIDNVKMTDIAEASGVGVATLYRRFSTKSRIALAGASLLWDKFNGAVRNTIETPEFLDLDGAERLERLLRIYSDEYVKNLAFVSFLGDLDHILTTGQVEPPDIAYYGGEVDSFYVVFDDAYELGRSDGSVKREINFRLFYQSVAHALMGVAQKLARGEVIPSDDFSEGKAELECIVDMAIRSLT